MISNKEPKARLLQQPGVGDEYDRLGPAHELARELIMARTRAGLSQEEVAERMGTTQSTIADLESGKLPSMETLRNFSLATGAKLNISLESLGPETVPTKQEAIKDLKERLNVKSNDWAKVQNILVEQAGDQNARMAQWGHLLLAIAEGSPLAANIPTPAERLDEVEKIIEHAKALKGLINPRGDDYWLSALAKAWPTEEQADDSPPSKHQLEQKKQARALQLTEVILRLETAAEKASQTLYKEKARRQRATKPAVQQLVRSLVHAARTGQLPFDVSELQRVRFCNLIDATCDMAGLEPPGDKKAMVARILKHSKNQGTQTRKI